MNDKKAEICSLEIRYPENHTFIKLFKFDGTIMMYKLVY